MPSLPDIFHAIYRDLESGKYCKRSCSQTPNSLSALLGEDSFDPKLLDSQCGVMDQSVRFLLWEYARQRKDPRFDEMVDYVLVPHTSVDLSKFSPMEIIDFVSPETKDTR